MRAAQPKGGAQPGQANFPIDRSGKWFDGQTVVNPDGSTAGGRVKK